MNAAAAATQPVWKFARSDTDQAGRRRGCPMEEKSKEQPEREMPKRTSCCLGRPVIQDDIAGLGANMQLREMTCRELKVKRNKFAGGKPNRS